MTDVWIGLLVTAAFIGGGILETVYRRVERQEGKIDAILKELGELEYEIKKLKRGE